MTREALLQLLHGERTPLMAVLNSSTPEERSFPIAGRWSIEGVLRHLMDFEEDILQGIADLRAGRNPFWWGVKDWNARNAERAALWPEKPLDDVLAAFVAHRKKVERAILELSDEEMANPLFFRSLRPLAFHDFEHMPGIRERLALARGDVREATVRWVEITRNETIVFLDTRPVESFEERLPGKWSIKEILIHLASRDRIWADVINRVSAGGSDELPHKPEDIHEHNRAQVAKAAHWSVARVLYELGEARNAWNQAMLLAPDWLMADPRYREWAEHRFRHDRTHLPQLNERYASWRKRQSS